MSSIREQMLADLGVASEPEALMLNGWMFDHVRKPGSQARTKWHFFTRAVGGRIVSACGKVELANGTVDANEACRWSLKMSSAPASVRSTNDELLASGMKANCWVWLGLPGIRTEASDPFGPPHLLRQKSPPQGLSSVLPMAMSIW